jgi:N-acyl-D-aspartate/D-glutamate deacylase
MMLDLLIRGGSVVDGTGAKAFRADVAVKDGCIQAVGPDLGELDARETIDASGLTVTPGFIDIHTHYDGQVSWDSDIAPSCYHGVTSIVMGNCGVGFAPARPDKHDWLINLLEGVEDIPGTALAEGLTWDWETFPDYMDAIARRKFALDIGAQVPHAPLRTYVMGERGADSQAHATAEEMAEMARLAAEAIEAGALGFSTSRTVAHQTRSGEVIGTYRAPEEELITIATAIGKTGKGVIQLISDAYLSADDMFARAELELIRKIAVASGRPVSVTVQQTANAPERWRMIFDWIDAMRADGLPISAQVAIRGVGGIMGFSSSTNPFMATPTWKRLAELPWAERLAAVRDPQVRARMLEEHKAPVEGPFGEYAARAFHAMFRMTNPVDYEPSPDVSMLAEANRTGKDPANYVYDVLLEEEGRRLIYFPAINYLSGDLSAVHAMLAADYALFGLSDGGAHCGMICDASFPTSAISLWPAGSKRGLSYSFEAMVHGYTQRAARHMGWLDRGVLAPGCVADINLIDRDELALPPPEMVQDLPAGGERLVQKALGYRATIKGGIVTVKDGELTGALPGKLVRGATARLPAASVASFADA